MWGDNAPRMHGSRCFEPLRVFRGSRKYDMKLSCNAIACCVVLYVHIILY